MTMCNKIVVFLFIHCVVTIAFVEKNFKTLHGFEDPPDGRQKTLIINAEDNELNAGGIRQKRATSDNLTKKPSLADNKIITKVSCCRNNSIDCNNIL